MKTFYIGQLVKLTEEAANRTGLIVGWSAANGKDVPLVKWNGMSVSSAIQARFLQPAQPDQPEPPSSG